MAVDSKIESGNWQPSTFGKKNVIGLLEFCANEIENYQIENELDAVIKNELDAAFEKVPSNEKPSVFNTRFEYLQRLRTELQNNVALFVEKKEKFREIENWITTKMRGMGVNTVLEPLHFINTIIPEIATELIKRDKQLSPFKQNTISDISRTKRAEVIIKDVLQKMELTDSDGNSNVKNGKGTVLFAVVDAIKDNSHSLLKKKYTDKELLNAFNNTLGSHFVQLKRDKRNIFFKKGKENAIAQIAKSQKLIK